MIKAFYQPSLIPLSCPHFSHQPVFVRFSLIILINSFIPGHFHWHSPVKSLLLSYWITAVGSYLVPLLSFCLAFFSCPCTSCAPHPQVSLPETWLAFCFRISHGSLLWVKSSHTLHSGTFILKVLTKSLICEVISLWLWIFSPQWGLLSIALNSRPLCSCSSTT